MDSPQTNHERRWVITAIYLVALFVFACALWRIGFVTPLNDALNTTTLIWLGVGVGLLLLPHASFIKIGDFEMKLQALNASVSEANQRAAIADDTVVLWSQKNASTVLGGLSIARGTTANDPWKGVFGGKSMDKLNGRKLSAKVTPLQQSPGWFAIELSLSSLPESLPLENNVQFFLHDTFPSVMPIVKAQNGSAQLHLKAWGAFTVGVLADEGRTKLELDLAELPDAPTLFRER